MPYVIFTLFGCRNRDIQKNHAIKHSYITIASRPNVS